MHPSREPIGERLRGHAARIGQSRDMPRIEQLVGAGVNHQHCRHAFQSPGDSIMCGHVQILVEPAHIDGDELIMTSDKGADLRQLDGASKYAAIEAQFPPRSISSNLWLARARARALFTAAIASTLSLYGKGSGWAS